MNKKVIILILTVSGILAIGAWHIYYTCLETEPLIDVITVYTSMPHANGIKRYAPVRVYGGNSDTCVGKVEKIWLSEKPGENKVYVEMTIRSELASRIAISNPDPIQPAADPEGIFSYIYVSKEGYLGDNLFDIYAGNQLKIEKQGKDEKGHLINGSTIRFEPDPRGIAQKHMVK